MDKNTLTDIERDLVDGLEGFLDDLKDDGVSIPERYTSRRIVLELEPRTYTPEDVKAVRRELKVSQAIFAQFLGVSPKTVRAWEQGKAISGTACRFMDEIRRDPEHWKRRLMESAKVRTCSKD